MSLPKSWYKVTPFSKYLALSMLVILPVLAFYYGRWVEKIVELSHGCRVQSVHADTN